MNFIEKVVFGLGASTVANVGTTFVQNQLIEHGVISKPLVANELFNGEILSDTGFIVAGLVYFLILFAPSKKS